MAVGADQAAVESDVAGVRRGDSFQLGGDEVFLGDAVFLVQQTQDFNLDAVRAVVIAERTGANENVQRLGRNGLIEGLFALFAAKVREQIVDDELGVLGVVANLDVDFAAVAADDEAVQLERDGDPLVFAAAGTGGRCDGLRRVLRRGGTDALRAGFRQRRRDLAQGCARRVYAGAVLCGGRGAAAHCGAVDNLRFINIRGQAIGLSLF